MPCVMRLFNDRDEQIWSALFLSRSMADTYGEILMHNKDVSRYVTQEVAMETFDYISLIVEGGYKPLKNEIELFSIVPQTEPIKQAINALSEYFVYFKIVVKSSDLESDTLEHLIEEKIRKTIDKEKTNEKPRH